MSHRPLNPEELTALRDFATKHGRTWKASLRDGWYNASLTGTLHALRNSHGPRWLERFTLPKLPPAMPVKSVGANHYGLPALPIRDDGSPGFIWARTEDDRKRLDIKWSGKTATPPAVGDTVTVTMNGIGPGTVLGYFIEHSWLGLHVWPSKPPNWFVRQNKTDARFYKGHAMVYGAEVDY